MAMYGTIDDHRFCGPGNPGAAFVQYEVPEQKDGSGIYAFLTCMYK